MWRYMKNDHTRICLQKLFGFFNLQYFNINIYMLRYSLFWEILYIWNIMLFWHINYGILRFDIVVRRKTLWSMAFDCCHSFSLQIFTDMMSSSNGNISRVPAFGEGDPPVNGGFPSQRPATQSFDVFFDPRLNKRLSKYSANKEVPNG